MVGKQGSQDESTQYQQQDASPADADVWAQLCNLASHEEADPVLHLLVNEAIARYEELRGITATIATRYRALVDAVPDAIIIHDETGNVIDANDAACRLYRKERGSILQSSLFSLNPGLKSDFLSALHEAHGNEHSLTAVVSLPHEDDTISDLELHAREYLDTGRVRIMATIRDLAQREVATRQLRDSESRLRNLLQSIDTGVIVWSRRGRILSANPAACRTLQMSEAELIALGSDQLDQWRYLDNGGHLIDASSLPWHRAIATGNPQESGVFGIDLPDETSTLWLSVSAVPHCNNSAGEPDQAVCVFTEVTKLQSDAMMFGQAQSLRNFGVWRLDLESHALLCSSQMHAILDIPESTPISRERMLEHFSGPDLDRFRQAITVARGGQPGRFDAHMTTSIGRRRHVRIHLRPIRAGENVSAVFGTLRDITTESQDATSN